MATADCIKRANERIAATKKARAKAQQRKPVSVRALQRRRERLTNPLAEQLQRQHQATLDRIDEILDGWLWIDSLDGWPDMDSNTMCSDDKAATSRVEMWNLIDIIGEIDMRGNFAKQLSDGMGRLIKLMSRLKRRLDRERAAGRIPLKDVVRFLYVRDGEVIEQFDSVQKASYMVMYHGGDVLNEFADGTTAPSESEWVTSAKEHFAENAAK